MEYGRIQQIIQKEISEKEPPYEIYQSPNPAETVKTGKKPQTRSSKAKSKFTLRAKAQKTTRRKFSTKMVKKEAIIPFIPRKVFQVLSLLRHDRFLKVVTNFFKPTKKVPAWNFDTTSKKKNKRR